MILIFPITKLLTGSPTNFKCTINVYGWGVGSFYFYTNSKPRTRYFLPNIIPIDQVGEYQAEILNNPPRVINYGCLEMNCSDLDVSKFGTYLFPYPNVLKTCYKRVLPKILTSTNAIQGLYKSFYTDREQQARCIKTRLQND